MERGILWLTLLAAFIWLGRRNEYQKWKLIATGHSSLRLYICGASSEWGAHPRPGTNQTGNLFPKDVQSIRLLVDDKPVLEMPPSKGRAIAQFVFPAATSVQVPTEIPSGRVGKHLQRSCNGCSRNQLSRLGLNSKR